MCSSIRGERPCCANRTSPPVPLPAVKSPPWHMKSWCGVESGGGGGNDMSAAQLQLDKTRQNRNPKRQTHGDDAVEGGALEVEGLAGAAHALLARAEGAEVLRVGRVVVIGGGEFSFWIQRRRVDRVGASINESADVQFVCFAYLGRLGHHVGAELDWG